MMPPFHPPAAFFRAASAFVTIEISLTIFASLPEFGNQERPRLRDIRDGAVMLERLRTQFRMRHRLHTITSDSGQVRTR
jgi:hypothetical protein